MKTKTIKKQKQKSQLVSPAKSSNEKNHDKSSVVNRIKTSAGYVTVTMDDAPEPRIELIETSSGIMRVEPATPKQKSLPDGGAPKKSKKQKQQPKASGHVATENPGMLSALRFKEKIFGPKKAQ